MRATVHSTLMVVGARPLRDLARRSGPATRRIGRSPFVLVVVGYLVLSAGAFVGGDLVYLIGTQVNRHAWRGAGAKWVALDLGDLPDIPEGGPTKAEGRASTTLVVIRERRHDPRPPRAVRPRRRAAGGGHARRRLRSSARGTARDSGSPTATSRAARRCTTSRPTRFGRTDTRLGGTPGRRGDVASARGDSVRLGEPSARAHRSGARFRGGFA